MTGEEFRAAFAILEMAVPVQKVRALRESGAVKRGHTMSFGGDYTVGKHSYDAVSMLLVLHPAPSLDLIRCLMWHDAAERWLGDLPAPAKWQFPELKAAYEEAENTVLRARYGVDMSVLTDDDRLWLEGIDRLEFIMWCRDQLGQGNETVASPYAAAQDSFEKKRTAWPHPLWVVYTTYRAKRLSEEILPDEQLDR